MQRYWKSALLHILSVPWGDPLEEEIPPLKGLQGRPVGFLSLPPYVVGERHKACTLSLVCAAAGLPDKYALLLRGFD